MLCPAGIDFVGYSCDHVDMVEEIAVRTALLEDIAAIANVDGSFTTSTVVRVDTGAGGFTLREVQISPPIRKTFPADDEQEDELVRFVAAGEDGTVRGHIALEYEPWNRRLTITDLALEAAYRGRGLGGALVCRAAEYGQRLGAVALWLEVSNVNAPAIRAYRRMGFEFCGLDTSLYCGTSAEGETALFMARSLQ